MGAAPCGAKIGKQDNYNTKNSRYGAISFQCICKLFALCVKDHFHEQSDGKYRKYCTINNDDRMVG